MDKKYNGFNNGRDKSDGVGGREVNHGTQHTMTNTIGQLLTEAFRLNELKAEVVERELSFPVGIITKLMNDEYYTNSVPVVLFKNLIMSLHIRPSEVYKAMIPTFNAVLSKETPETIKKKPHGYQLWENKESVLKYTEHLKLLINND